MQHPAEPEDLASETRRILHDIFLLKEETNSRRKEMEKIRKEREDVQRQIMLCKIEKTSFQNEKNT